MANKKYIGLNGKEVKKLNLDGSERINKYNLDGSISTESYNLDGSISTESYNLDGTIKLNKSNTFSSLWNVSSDGELVQLPISNSYTIDWGDGNQTVGQTSHTYLSQGEYIISVEGEISDWSFNNSGDKDKIVDIISYGNLVLNIKTFYGCQNLGDISATDEPKINNLNSIFRNAKNMTANSSMSRWNIGDTTTLLRLFDGAELFNEDISGWNTSEVNSLSYAFNEAESFSSNIGVWDTGNVANMTSTFNGAISFNHDISSWNFSKVTSLVNFMANKSSENYSPSHYDALLNKWIKPVSQGGLNISRFSDLNIGMGTIKYTSAGEDARNELISRGFIISDGGII